MKTKSVFTITGCVLGSALVLSPVAARQEAETPVTTRSIPGVVAAGTKVERVWTGLEAADGLISEADGIAIDAMGRLISVERKAPRVRVLVPERRVLADTYEGEPLQRLSDIVADQKGGVYFTEGANSAVYYLNSGGGLTRVASDIDGANGITLSPDERTLYVTNREAGVLAYDVAQNGRIDNRRPFVKPEGGQDGMAVDGAGRLYVTGQSGVQVFSPRGESLGLIPVPRPTTTLAFAGPDKRTLYVIGRGNDGPGGDSGDARSMYRIAMIAEGFKGRAK
jgi:gluconolactonase